MVNKNSHYRIKGMDKDPYGVLLGMNEKTNLWGYRVEEGLGAADRQDNFLHTPGGTDEKPNVIVDTASKHDNAGCKGKNQCTVHVTFGASLDLANLPAGKYFTEVTYTVTANINWPRRDANPDPSDICRSGDDNSSCLVDLDPNMIPVKYNTETAEWESVANPEDAAHQGEWYNYGNKQWANAVTVKKPQDYKYQAKPVKQSDILGFWVYIPRYAYEVMRRDGTDKPIKGQNFDIKFENTKTPPKRPLACKIKNDRDKDYRTECGVSRELPLEGGEVSTWSTHPAFTFGNKKLNGRDVPNELNGIWFGKFETTGTTYQPTVLPNQAHISGEDSGMNKQVGNFYSLAKTLGINDPNNVGGSGFTTKHNHNLTKFSSHMVNNNDWGAAAYLSASKYGAGFDKVQINANSAKHTNYDDTYGTTGCGPQSDGDTSVYYNSGALGTPRACGYPQHAYNGTLGQLASTTNNIYGIYDMSGGVMEYVAASYTSDTHSYNSSTKYFSQPANPPYVNNYNFDDLDKCTFATCGGQALYETNNGSTQWSGDYYNNFVKSSNPWFIRGGSYYDGSGAGLFFTYGGHGSNYYGSVAFRVALVSALQD